jgi:TPR repeat protein
VAKDDKQAFAWYGKAAQQGNADGQYAVGKCYLKGRGVAANQVRAKSWVMKAIRNPSGGSEVYAKIKQEAAMVDADATKILQIIK